MYLGAIFVFPRSVLFGISFTLKAKKKLTTRINCFHLWFSNFPNWKICNSRLNFRRGGEGRELPQTTVLRPFPALLSAPAVEPWVLSCNTAKKRFIRFSLTLHLQCSHYQPYFDHSQTGGGKLMAMFLLLMFIFLLFWQCTPIYVQGTGSVRHFGRTPAPSSPAPGWRGEFTMFSDP